MKKIGTTLINSIYIAYIKDPYTKEEEYMIGVDDTREGAILDMIEANPTYFNIEII